MKISVLMPVRESRFLAPAMSSLLAQTLDDFELVVIDDASDTETQRLLADHAAADDRIRILRRETSEGLASALNFGVDACQAPLIARADADDVYHPERLERQAAAFDDRPELAALSCGWRRIDETGRVLYTHRPATGPSIVRFRVIFGSPLLHPGAMVRAEVMRAYGGYDPAFWTAQDADLWARMAPKCDLDNLPEALVDWRAHGRSISASRGAAGRALSMSIRARQHAAYLGAEQPPRLVETSVDTLSSATPLPLADISDGERQLARFLAQARRVEPAEVIAYFRTETATALYRQARWALRSRRPIEAARIAARAALWRSDRNIEAAPGLAARQNEYA